MPGIINPFLGVVTSGLTPVTLTEPWAEVTRQGTISSGKLTISGYDFTGVQVLRLYVNALAVTTDDSQVSFRFIIGGSEVSAAYRWVINRVTSGVDDISASNSDTGIMLSSTSTRGVGNASAEGLSAVITIHDPASTSLYKKCFYHSTYLKPDGTLMEVGSGNGQLDNTGAITGVVVLADSNLTAGNLLLLGVA